MSFRHYLAFLVLGLSFVLLPRAWPGCVRCQPRSVGQARDEWLVCMGWIQVLIGAAGIARHASAAAGRSAPVRLGGMRRRRREAAR